MDADVILRNRSLVPNRNRFLLERMHVGDSIHAGDEEVDPGLQRLDVFAEPLNHAGSLLRDDSDSPVHRRLDLVAIYNKEEDD